MHSLNMIYGRVDIRNGDMRQVSSTGPSSYRPKHREYWFGWLSMHNEGGYGPQQKPIFRSEDPNFPT